ncbi:hypothetical protein HDU76_001758, partial [Blyttiomyces sp. JEL0837]
MTSQKEKRRSISLWDELPIEIRSDIIARCDVLTRHLNNDLTNDEIKMHGTEIWKIVFDKDLVHLNILSLLPLDQLPNIYNGLGLVRSEQMYQSLCKLIPPQQTVIWDNYVKPVDFKESPSQCSEFMRPDRINNNDLLKGYLENDHIWNAYLERRYGASLEIGPTGYKQLDAISHLLIHIPLRQLWLHHLPDWFDKMDRTRLFTIACCFGHTDLAKHVLKGINNTPEDINEFLKNIGTDCLQKASEKGFSDTVKFLISFDSFYTNETRHHALKLACFNGHAEIVTILTTSFTNYELSKHFNRIYQAACQVDNVTAVRIIFAHSERRSTNFLYMPGLVQRATNDGSVQIIRFLFSTWSPAVGQIMCQTVLRDVVFRGSFFRLAGVLAVLDLADLEATKKWAVETGKVEVLGLLGRLESGEQDRNSEW